MIDWSTISAEEVREKGKKVDTITTSLSKYGLYIYRDRLVQIHEEDGELAVVWRHGRTEWVHLILQWAVILCLIVLSKNQFAPATQ